MHRLVHCLPTECDRYAEASATVGDDSMIWGESVLVMVNPDKVGRPWKTVRMEIGHHEIGEAYEYKETLPEDLAAHS